MPSLDFKGKAFVYAHHLSVPFRELAVDADKSLPAGKPPGLDGNLIIHGDNLEALKALLPVYAGKVDCIYIDPPYNTGNEGWCYNDAVRSPLMREWLKKSANPVEKEDLERHDKWLCMMWPRLQLLRELLSETGTLWVTLDDNEMAHARVLLDEVFGEESFVGELIWQKRTSRENRATLATVHDYLLLYSKCDAKLWKTHRNLLDAGEGGYSNPDDDPRGEWASIPFSAQGFRKDQMYPITTPTGKTVEPPRGRCWGAREEVFKELLADNRIYFPDGGNGRPRVKQFKDQAKGLVPMSIWFSDEVGDTEESKKEILEIFHDESLPFDTPKPTRLIERVIQIATKNDSLILDSFAGSGTTAHAVLALNAKDGGNRRFILVETEKYADTLTAERVRRVAQGYAFTGTQRTELLREKLNWTRLKSAAALVEKAESVKQLEGASYDEVKIAVEDGALVVTGERKVQDKAPGLGGSFTYCTLGAPMTLDALLADGLPSFDSLAKYVFYTATGKQLPAPPAKKAAVEGFIGETDLYRVHLLYQPDAAWLASDAAALTEAQAERIAAANKDRKTALVFAPAKFLSQRELSRHGITFCQLPYAIHRLLGD